VHQPVTLTRSGIGLLVAAVVLCATGWWWGYNELLWCGVLAAIAVAAAVLDSRRHLSLRVHRTSDDVRVPRGDPLRVHYSIVNASPRRSAMTLLVDEFQGSRRQANVPRIRPGRQFTAELQFPTRRRGAHPVGPAALLRGDVFGLVASERPVHDDLSVLVHPRIYDLTAESGVLRVITEDAVDRRHSSDPHATFNSLRPYVAGDDPRLIHWPTTARTGSLMVREFYEVRRPEFVVTVDVADHVCDADDFEEVVDVAASVANLGLRAGLGTVLRTTLRDMPGRSQPITETAEILDLLTPLHQGAAADLVSAAALFQSGLPSVMVMVTGPDGPSSAIRGVELTVLRIGKGADIKGLACRALSAENALEFAQRWAVIT
jgi:uncharacterized protein (DUF58 family)